MKDANSKANQSFQEFLVVQVFYIRGWQPLKAKGQSNPAPV